MAAFLEVLLVNPDSVDPEDPGLVFVAKISQSGG